MDRVSDMDKVPDRDRVPDMNGVPDREIQMGYLIVNWMPDSRWDTRLWMGCHIVDGVPDRGGIPGRVLPSDSTGKYETLMSHQIEILHSLILRVYIRYFYYLYINKAFHKCEKY